MNGWDQRYAKVRDGYQMAEQAIELGYEYPSGFVAFFKEPLNYLDFFLIF